MHSKTRGIIQLGFTKSTSGKENDIMRVDDNYKCMWKEGSYWQRPSLRSERSLFASELFIDSCVSVQGVITAVKCSKLTILLTNYTEPVQHQYKERKQLQLLP